jgi:flagellar hook-associated protein 1 FlgK
VAGVRSIFDIAKGALTANQLALQTVSHNIANVDTKGYARQEAVLEESMPLPSPVGLLGNGVKVIEVRRYIDKYLENTIVKKRTDLEFQKTSGKYLEQMEGILNEDNSKLTENMTQFFNAWQELSTDPSGIPARIALLTRGENLARGIRTVYRDLRGLQSEINQTIGQEVDSINRITTSIADLNQRIFDGAGDGEANDYLNRRTELLKELSGKLEIVSFEDNFGRITVMTGKGKALVDGLNHWNLQAHDPQGTGFSRIAWEDSGGNLSDITSDIESGTLGALLTERDVHAEEFIDQLNGLAQTIMNVVNQTHEAGYNLNQTSGISFFKPLTQSYAADIDVSAEIKNDVNNIASTSSPDRPTDNDIALQIAALGEADLTFTANGTTVTTTPAHFVSSILAGVGELTRNSIDSEEYQQNTMNLLEKQREGVSGVSLDEELTNLMQYQRAYQAAARLITVADELLVTLMETAP